MINRSGLWLWLTLQQFLMLEPDVWEVLSDVGFASVLSFPVDECERSYVEKFLFICSAKSLGTSNTSFGQGWWEKLAVSVPMFDVYTTVLW